VHFWDHDLPRSGGRTAELSQLHAGRSLGRSPVAGKQVLIEVDISVRQVRWRMPLGRLDSRPESTVASMADEARSPLPKKKRRGHEQQLLQPHGKARLGLRLRTGNPSPLLSDVSRARGRRGCLMSMSWRGRRFAFMQRRPRPKMSELGSDPPRRCRHHSTPRA
jgi:hypothetical protein